MVSCLLFSFADFLSRYLDAAPPPTGKFFPLYSTGKYRR